MVKQDNKLGGFFYFLKEKNIALVIHEVGMASHGILEFNRYKKIYHHLKNHHVDYKRFTSKRRLDGQQITTRPT